MRVAFLGNWHVDYTSESHHAKSLESLGHTVVRLQEGRDLTDKVLAEALRSRLFVWVKTHGWQMQGSRPMEFVLSKLRAAGIPSVAYHLDLYVGITERWKTYQHDLYMRGLEHFFTVDPKLVDWFKSNNTATVGHYLPAGVYDKECYLATPREHERFDVCFVGSKRYHPSWPYRTELIGWLERTYGSRFRLYGQDGLGVVRGDRLNQVYANSRVVVGDAFSPGFNYPGYFSDRIPETLGRGGMLIHPKIGGLDKFYTDRKHLVLYDYRNFDQLKSLIDHYLSSEKEREAIRVAGHQHVKDHHTYRHRWEHILATVFP